MPAVLNYLIACAFFLPNSGISMFGIKIGDAKSSLKNIKLEIVSQEDETIKYRTENGNDLSLTLVNGKVAYLENDWLHNSTGKQPLFSDFRFGETSLRDVRKKFGTNGFTYKTRGMFNTDTDLIGFNCFEFDSPGNEILVMITKVSLNEKNLSEDNIADMMKLDALIIADKDYMDQICGPEKIFDPNYRKIQP